MRSVWDAEWFVQSILSLLCVDDARCLAVCATMAHRTVLSHALRHQHSTLAPISSSDLRSCAAIHGWWLAVEELQKRSRASPTITRVSRTNGRASLRAVIEAMAESQVTPSSELLRVIRQHFRYPVRYPTEAMYASCRRGELAAVIWWHFIVQYDPREAIASSGDGNVVQWLLDHAHEQLVPPVSLDLTCSIRFNDEQLRDIGVIKWRDQFSGMAYAFVKTHGCLPPVKEFRRDGYPLMVWAASEGHLQLLQRLDHHPVAKDTLIGEAVVLAAANGHRHFVEWLLVNRFDDIEVALARSMQVAATRGDLELLQLIYNNPQGVSGSLNMVFRAAATSGHTRVLAWLFDTCFDSRIPPKYLIDAAATNGHLDVVQYLYEQRQEPLSVSALEVAVTHSHLEVAKWLLANLTSLTAAEDSKMLQVAARTAAWPMLEWCMEAFGHGQACRDAVRAWCLDQSQWSWPAISQRAPHITTVLQQIHSWDPSTFAREASQLRLASVARKGGPEAVEWLLQVVPESTENVPLATDIEWFQRPYAHPGRLARFASRRRGYQQFKTDDDTIIQSAAAMDTLILRYRPRLSLSTAEFPVWAVLRGDVAWLDRLEELQHPRLFDGRVLSTVLHNSRDARVMIWFLARQPPHWMARIPQIIKWAARYAAVTVLSRLFLHRPISSSDQEQTGWSYCTTATRMAAAHGHVDVMEFVYQHSRTGWLGKSSSVASLVELAARHGQVSILEWVVGHTRCLSQSTLVTSAANMGAIHGHLAVLQWASTLSDHSLVAILPRSLRRAAGRGHDAVVRWIAVRKRVQ